MPVASSTDRAIAAAKNLATTICNPSTASPLSPVPTDTRTALDQLSQIFKNYSSQDNAPMTTTELPPHLPKVAPLPMLPPPNLIPAGQPPIPRVAAQDENQLVEPMPVPTPAPDINSFNGTTRLLQNGAANAPATALPPRKIVVSPPTRRHQPQ